MMKPIVLFALLAGLPVLPAHADELPAEWNLAGQAATCGARPTARTFTLMAREKIVPIGMGFSADQMVYEGAGAPALLEACAGDTVTFILHDTGKMAHGLDVHAFFISPEHFGPVNEGGTLTYTRKVTLPGAFFFHCASGPITDVHIKSGMVGALIVYPREGLRPAKEIAVLQGGFFGEPDPHGLIEPETNRIMRNDPFILAFNGRLEHDPVHVQPHQLVRVWFVNAGPGTSSVHVIGTILERFYASGNPENVERDVQTGLVPAGGGAAFELRLPEPGTYPLVDHDNLRFLPFGMAIPLVAD